MGCHQISFNYCACVVRKSQHLYSTPDLLTQEYARKNCSMDTCSTLTVSSFDLSPISLEADSVKSQRHGGPGSQSSRVPNAYDYLCTAEFYRKGLLKVIAENKKGASFCEQFCLC